MKKIFALFLMVVLTFVQCSQSDDDNSDSKDIIFALMHAQSQAEIARLNAALLGDFELRGVTYTALNDITESFTDNKLEVSWFNTTTPLFGSKYLTGYYYSIITSFNNGDNSFYALRGRVNYENAGCQCTSATDCSNVTYTPGSKPMVDGQSCTTGTMPGAAGASITDPYRGDLRQDWSKAEYYRYRYTEDQADGYFYLCVEAGPYATLAEAQADTFKATFPGSTNATTYTSNADYLAGKNTSGCPDRGSASGEIVDSSWTVGEKSGYRTNIFDGAWFQLKKVK